MASEIPARAEATVSTPTPRANQDGAGSARRSLAATAAESAPGERWVISFCG